MALLKLCIARRDDDFESSTWKRREPIESSQLRGGKIERFAINLEPSHELSQATNPMLAGRYSRAHKKRWKIAAKPSSSCSANFSARGIRRARKTYGVTSISRRVHARACFTLSDPSTREFSRCQIFEITRFEKHRERREKRNLDSKLRRESFVYKGVMACSSNSLQGKSS